MFLSTFIKPKEKPSPTKQPDWAKTDKNSASSLYILKEMYRRDKRFERLARRYVDIAQGIFNYDKMIMATAQWSMAHKTIVNLAAHLLNEAYPFRLADLDYLNEEEKQIVAKALKIRFGF